MKGVLNKTNFQGHIAPQVLCILEASGLVKKVVQSCPKSCRREGRSHLRIREIAEIVEKAEKLDRGDCARERMQNDGQWVLGRSRRMVGQGLEQKSHLLALAVPDKARQPNAVAEVMQFDRHPRPP